MFNFEFKISNPFVRDKWKSLYSNHFKISKNKVFEIEMIFFKSTIFLVDLDINFNKVDHAGPKITLGLFGLEISLHLYDTRHWNYEENRWCKYENNDSFCG